MPRRSAGRCPNCEAPSAPSQYCPNCGQEKDIETQTWKDYIVDVSYDFLSVDGKIWKAAVDLVVHPGVLTLDYIRGRRVSRPVPSRLFLVMSVLVFAAVPWVLHLVGAEGMKGSFASEVVEHAIVAVISTVDGMTIPKADYQRLIEERASLTALIAVIPVGLILAAYGRPGRRMTNVHMAHAFHISTASMLLSMLSMFSVWYITPSLFLGVWYGWQWWKRRGQRWLWPIVKRVLLWLISWPVSVAWMIGVFLLYGYLGGDVGSTVEEFTLSEAPIVVILAILPLLFMVFSTAVLMLHGAELFYISNSLLTIDEVPAHKALAEAFVITSAMTFVRAVLVVAAVYA